MAATTTTTTVTISKFVGTITLGLLTGTSYTLSALSLPPLLSLPSSTPAHSTFTTLHTFSTRQQLFLSGLSSTSFLLAYTLSPPRARHPFLLWATLAIGAGYAREIYGFVTGKKGKVESGAGERVRGAGGTGSGESSGDESEWEVEMGKSGVKGAGAGEGLNGEVVREGMERWRKMQMGKAVAWGLGWGVSVLGLWGDGFGIRA